MFDGQSLVNSPPFGPTAGSLRTYPYQVSYELTKGLVMHLAAISGTTYATRALAINSLKSKIGEHALTIVIDCGGQQELLADTSAAAILAIQESYADTVRAAGADVVIECTTPPAQAYSAGQNTVRLAWNDMLRANANRKFNAIVDFAAVPEFANPPAGSSTYFYDGTHFQEAAAALVAPLIVTALHNLQVI